MRRYVIAHTASRDITDIVDYLSDRDIALGESFIRDFTEKCRYLTQYPMIGKAYPQLQSGLRGIVLNRHLIFYTVTDEAITVVRVIRGDRNLDALFN
ncbi:type II toxin-antitoxin system RelE/ParE family toxin [filamentous cyanobacterium LEGE 11480]|uniref:Type II toxin-antitoxin system RelE/ParE family toxin n=1 Tax=Romeriopsis navalis LEGE 11480 TaxID=2777977 RepID=A0A928VPX1_9CYAN|nr:type II toxin-antitoxin system RelE/ParE family toxin [Romeriopsis navalis]MBE9031587.1 type II toxin-antitoxin system RelE/ParE family toxin [Romeriopsis navalis LEGE 11480]